MENEQITLLRRDKIDPDPIKQFARWLQDAEKAELPQPNAMTLATSNRLGKPSARIVLLRNIDARGFVFFTNYESRKAQDLLENPNAALVFCWLTLGRQIRVEGSVEKVDANESDTYFAHRPRGHQLEAHASPQSQILPDRSSLEAAFDAVSQKFAGQDVPRPLHWGGYRVIPEVLEFWQEGEHRLHDRLCYRRETGADWIIERLSP